MLDCEVLLCLDRASWCTVLLSNFGCALPNIALCRILRMMSRFRSKSHSTSRTITARLNIWRRWVPNPATIVTLHLPVVHQR